MYKMWKRLSNRSKKFLFKSMLWIRFAGKNQRSMRWW